MTACIVISQNAGDKASIEGCCARASDDFLSAKGTKPTGASRLLKEGGRLDV